MDVIVNDSTEEVCSHQPISEQTLEDVAHGLQCAGIFHSHPIPLAGLDGGALTRNHREWRSDIIP
jgi:proteasome lid subunit RPN8/RPN11